MSLSTPTLTRLFDVYRQTASSRTAIALVIANAIPLVGVLFFGWSLWTILVLYWVENGIVGLWNIPKILLARGSLLPGFVRTAAFASATSSAGATGPSGETAGSDAGPAMPFIGRVAMAAFFVIHYGGFWLVHGVFVFVLPTFLGFGSLATSDTFPTFDPASGLPGLVPPVAAAGGFGEIVWSSVLVGVAALFISHGVSFFVNYLGQGEYLRRSAAAQMAAPYGRVVVLHLTIIFGAFAIAFLGAPILLLLVLVVGKTLFDLSLHLREHAA
jgi:cytochrome c oxidase subunit IV